MNGLRVSTGSGFRLTRSWVDFQGVAELIDKTLGLAQESRETLLRVLLSSDECLEARVVLDLVIRCHDPLSPPGQLCRNALKSASDLDDVLRDPSIDLENIHACALLNLVDALLGKGANENRRKQARMIRPTVKVAAIAELTKRRDEVSRMEFLFEHSVPGLWALLEEFVRAAGERTRLPLG